MSQFFSNGFQPSSIKYTMKQRYNKFNQKREILEPATRDFEQLQRLSLQVSYGGNPEHKKNPGDFGLNPPSSPRQGKSLCDAAHIFNRAEALKLLRLGVCRGLVSRQSVNGWPRNIWSVKQDGDKSIPLEAQLENPVRGVYHGYPMPASDPLAHEILRRWGKGQNHE